MIPADVLRSLVARRGVSDTELEVLIRVIEGGSTRDIAQSLAIKPDAARKRLGEVYKKFGITGSGPGKLAKLQKILMDEYQTCQNRAEPSVSGLAVSKSVPQESDKQVHQDWGEAIDIEFFCGRKTELSQLERWIVDERCRLVAILGMGGIGKTSLSVKLAKQIQPQFEYVFWRSLRHALSLDELLINLINGLSNGRETEADLPTTLDGRISRLIYYLRQHRCLLMLDNFETILKMGDRAGYYRETHAGYGELLRRMGEEQHNSCLLITSREKPREIASLEGETLPIRALTLDGLSDKDGREVLKAKGFSEVGDQWKKLIELYGGNPLALKIVATAIQDLFEGSIAEFLEQRTIVFGDIRDLLDQQFNRLSEPETEIMYWLAINREPASLSELRRDLVSPESISRSLETVESLGRRSLIEKTTVRSFTLQPVVLEYVLDRFIELIGDELQTCKIHLFNRHALIKAQAKDYIRINQIRLVLKPIAETLISLLRHENQVETHLQKILHNLQEGFPSEPGYAGGNIVNLLIHLKIDLTGYDFSNLNIWQAYLQDVNLHRVNFSGADLSKSVFAETFSSILSVAFSPKGDRLVTGDANGVIRVLSADGEQLITIREHQGWVRSVGFSPNGDTIFSGGDDHIVKLWNARTGQCLRLFQEHTSRIWSVAFSPDGKRLASGSDDRTVKLWDIETGRCLATFPGHTGRVRDIAFSPDGTRIASGSSDRTIRIWEVETGACLQTLDGHNSRIWSVRFSPDGTRIASGSSDRTIRIWEVETGTCLTILNGHISGVFSVSFNPNGDRLVSGSDDRTIKLWDLNTATCLTTLSDHRGRVWSVSFDPTGDRLVSGSDDQTVRLWYVDTLRCIKTLRGYRRGVRSVAFRSDGQTLASGGEDRTVRLWNWQTSNPPKLLQDHTSRIWSVAFSPNGHMLASSSDDQTVRLWNVDTGQSLHTLPFSDWIRSVCFSPDNNILAIGSDNRKITLYHLAAQKMLRDLAGHQGWILSIAFSPDGKTLISGSDDHTLRFWDVSTGQCFEVLQDHDDAVVSVAYSPYGTRIASGSSDRTIRLWHAQTRQCIHILRMDRSWVRSVAFSPDGCYLASGNEDASVNLWDVATGTLLTTLSGHTSRVRTVAFSPDGHHLASGSNDEAIIIWDVKTGTRVKSLKIESPYQGMNITGARGLTESNRETLITLGAIDHG